MSNSIEEVRLTADEAIVSKMACVDLGYYKDNYIHNFIRRKGRRTPLINRGYYSRVAAIEKLVKRFIQHYNKNCQLISLGGGYDTLYFRLHDMNLQPKLFVDLDLLETCVSKATIMRNKTELASVLFGDSPVDKSSREPTIRTGNYILQPMDLTDLAKIKSFMEEGVVDLELPTLLLSECVLIYINPNSVNPTLQYLQQILPNSSIVVYEQIRPSDPFGKMMLRNLHERGCDLLSLETYPDTQDQKNRYLGFGYRDAFCEDMRTLYSSFLERSEIQRISRIEMFDEFEEWNLIQSHYCILVAAQGSFHDWFADFVKLEQ